jgi:hypothetical protein
MSLENPIALETLSVRKTRENLEARALNGGGADEFPIQTFLDDAPLPENYAADAIHLLPQSHERLFLYWNLARDPFTTLHKAFGHIADEYRLFARLVNETSGEETWHEAAESHSMWLDVAPGASYRAELILRAENYPPLHLLASETVMMPTRRIAEIEDEAVEFQTVPSGFAQILHEAGYTRDALALALERDIKGQLEDATRKFALALTGVELPLLRDNEMYELRAVLAALAFGTPFGEIKPVSPALTKWLRRVRGLNENEFENSSAEKPDAASTLRVAQRERLRGASEAHFITPSPSHPARDSANDFAHPLAHQSSARTNPTRSSRVRLPQRSTSRKF